MDPIYLDHNATTPLAPAAAEAMERTAREGWGNPAAQHALGRRARRLVEDARDQIGELLGLDLGGRRPDRLIFTSGGTEANNLALAGLGLGDKPSPAPPADAVAISTIEHPSISALVPWLEARGTNVTLLPVGGDGRVVLGQAAELLRGSLRLVSVMLGNNETGIVQPVAELAALCRERGVLMHTDAVQAVGKIEIDLRALGVAAMSLAAHKFHGPLGIGALAVRGDVPLRPLLCGGFQQAGARPGTEAPALVAGMAAALAAFHHEAAARTARLAALRDDLQARLLAGAPDIVVHGAHVLRLPQTLNVAFVGVDRQAMFVALDQAGVACSTGSACASGSSEPSATLRAMGLPPALVESSLRFSVGTTTTPEEIADAAERILRVFNELRAAEKGGKKAAAGRVAT